jgi:hypothetical protein
MEGAALADTAWTFPYRSVGSHERSSGHVRGKLAYKSFLKYNKPPVISHVVLFLVQEHTWQSSSSATVTREIR